MIFEGDRRFPVVIRLSEAQRADLSDAGQVQVPAPGGKFVPLASVADIRSPTDRTRSAAKTANAAWWCRPMCAGAMSPA
jgi:cobalt-zinc-cadmium resistance protein CzcA